MIFLPSSLLSPPISDHSLILANLVFRSKTATYLQILGSVFLGRKRLSDIFDENNVLKYFQFFSPNFSLWHFRNRTSAYDQWLIVLNET